MIPTKTAMFNQSYGVHITPLVNSSLGGEHTHTHTDIHMCIQMFANRSNFKKPGTHPPQTQYGLKIKKYANNLEVKEPILNHY